MCSRDCNRRTSSPIASSSFVDWLFQSMSSKVENVIDWNRELIGHSEGSRLTDLGEHVEIPVIECGVKGRAYFLREKNAFKSYTSLLSRTVLCRRDGGALSCIETCPIRPVRICARRQKNGRPSNTTSREFIGGLLGNDNFVNHMDYAI